MRGFVEVEVPHTVTQLKLEPRPPIHSVSPQREFSMINCENIVFRSSFEVIQDHFALLCGIIGPENSRHFINQSVSQLKSITICHSRFPALQAVCVFTYRFLWSLGIFSFPLIGCCDHFGVGLTSLNRNAL